MGSTSACNSGARGRAGSRYQLYTWYDTRQKTLHTLVVRGLVERAKSSSKRGIEFGGIEFGFLLRVMIHGSPRSFLIFNRTALLKY